MKTEDKENLLIGLVDADLMDGGTRHPNLAMLKIAGFLKDNNHYCPLKIFSIFK